MKVTFQWSEAFVRKTRLESGENAPTSIDGEVEVAQLSKQSREFLLDYHSGSYPDSFDDVRLDECGDYNKFNEGPYQFFLESDEPITPQSVDAVIAGILAKVDVARKELAAKKAQEKANELRDAVHRYAWES